MFLARQCQTRKSPTYWRGSLRGARKLQDNRTPPHTTRTKIILRTMTLNIRNPQMPNDNTLSRRGFFTKLGILFNGVVGLTLAVPVVKYLLSSITRGHD